MAIGLTTIDQLDESVKTTMTMSESFMVKVIDTDDDEVFLVFETLEERFRLILPTTHKQEVASLIDEFTDRLMELIND